MATKKQPQKNNAGWEVQFISCELDKDTKQAARNWDPKFEQTMDIIDRLTAEGYKISISPDKFHDCIGAFATIADINHPHHGLCLTARGPSFILALKMLAFKHSQVLQEDWTTQVAERRSTDNWG